MTFALRLATPAPKASWVTLLSDDELVSLSALQGRPIGLFRTGGITTLVAHQTATRDDGKVDQADDRDNPNNPSPVVPNDSW